MHHRMEGLMRDAGFSDRQFRDGGTLSDRSVTDAIQQVQEEIRKVQRPVQTSSDARSSSSGDTTGSGSETQLSQNALYQAGTGSGSGILGSIGQTTESLLGGGGLLGGLLGGLSPLIYGIASLFGGGSPHPTPLVQYEAPDSLHFQEALSGGVTGDAVYGPGGQPRVAPITEMALERQAPSIGQNGQVNGSATESPAPSQQGSAITVQVQAMDSQSFLDRRDDIANAVRQAMLNSHPINDVINDL